MMTTIPHEAHYRRGDVVLVVFPNSDLRTASPVVIVQAMELQTGIAQCIVAMITSNRMRANHPSRVVIRQSSDEGQRSGLLSDSVVMTDNLATIVTSALIRTIGQLDMGAVDTALRYTLAS